MSIAPSRSAIPTMKGRLWSAVSLVAGLHFSLSFPRMLNPASWVSTVTDATSPGSPILDLTSSAAHTAVWAWYSTGQYLMYVSFTLKALPGPPNSPVSSLNGPDTCLKNPISPSNTGAGPVIPSAARRAAKTPFRAASANDAPFHMDSSPARTCLIAMWPLSAMFTAWAALLSSRPMSLAEAKAVETRP